MATIRMGCDVYQDKSGNWKFYCNDCKTEYDVNVDEEEARNCARVHVNTEHYRWSDDGDISFMNTLRKDVEKRSSVPLGWTASAGKRLFGIIDKLEARSCNVDHNCIKCKFERRLVCVNNDCTEDKHRKQIVKNTDYYSELERAVIEYSESLIDGTPGQRNEAMANLQFLARKLKGEDKELREIDIVFDDSPSNVGGRFVEVEDSHTRNSLGVGEWIERKDGYWALRLKALV